MAQVGGLKENLLGNRALLMRSIDLMVDSDELLDDFAFDHSRLGAFELQKDRSIFRHIESYRLFASEDHFVDELSRLGVPEDHTVQLIPRLVARNRPFLS